MNFQILLKIITRNKLVFFFFPSWSFLPKTYFCFYKVLMKNRYFSWPASVHSQSDVFQLWTCTVTVLVPWYIMYIGLSIGLYFFIQSLGAPEDISQAQVYFIDICMEYLQSINWIQAYEIYCFAVRAACTGLLVSHLLWVPSAHLMVTVVSVLETFLLDLY